MFESDERKVLKGRQNKIASIGASAGKKFGGKQDFENQNTVYSELKLSEKLSNQLTEIRLEISKLKEELEDAIYEKEDAVEQLEQIKKSSELKE